MQQIERINEMFKVTCIKCGKTIKENPIKDSTTVCQTCVDELLNNMSPKELLAHAKVGLDAVIDEVTGYQNVRQKGDLNKRLKKYKG